MKKFTLIMWAALLSATISTVSAQEGIKFGVKAGVNFAKMAVSGSDEDEGLKALTSFQIGALVDLPISSAFSVQPGLALSGKGYKISESDEGFSVKETTNIMYLEIPVNAVYKISNFYVGAGPYAAFAISGKDKWTVSGDGESESDDEKLTFGSGDDADYKRGDFGVNILAGYQLNSGINIGINYGLGLSNIIPGSADYKTKNRVFSVSVGFLF